MGNPSATPSGDSGSPLAQALAALSGQNGQQVISAITSALQGDPQDLKNVLADIDANSQNIDTILGQVQGREQHIQQIDEALQQLQAQVPALNAEIAGIRDRITVRTKADVENLFGEDLLR
jgi:peptidoglycan hydrolase CwlO-like protein